MSLHKVVAGNFAKPVYTPGDHFVASKGNSPNGEQRSKVRFMLVDFEGSSADLHQLAQTFSNAVKAAPPIVMSPPPALPAVRQQAALSTDKPPQIGLFDQQTEGEVIEVEPVESPPPAPKASNGVRRKPKTPSIIEDIDFNGQPMPFKEFMQGIGVEDHGRRYLAIAQWFKEHRHVAEIGADHIYTCYKFLTLTVPEDVTAPFRALKAKGAVGNGSARGMYRITHIGENTLTEARKKD